MEIKWRGGPSSGEGYPWNKKPKPEAATKGASDKAPNESATPGESIEQMAARRFEEARAGSERNALRKQAAQADAEVGYGELMRKVDAKVEKDIKTAEDATKRLENL